MLKLAPETIANQLDSVIAGLLADATHYFDHSSLEIRRLIADAKKLINADAYQGYVALGNIHHLCGDFDQMRRFHKNADQLKYNVDTHGWWTACECNLGFISVAQDHFEIVANPKNGSFTQAFHLGFACGAFQLLGEYIEQADKMKLDLSGLPVSLAMKARSVLSNAGITDAHVAEMLDLAGEVLREDRVFFAGDPANLVKIEEGDSLDSSCVHMTFRIPLSGKEVAGMATRLTDKIAERIERIPDQFQVSFRPM